MVDGDKSDKVIFKLKIVPRSSTFAVKVPQELADFLNVELGSNVEMSSEVGKYGKYITMWKAEVQDEQVEQEEAAESNATVANTKQV